MAETVLVTYATRNDSTAGVAEAIGDTLAENGYAVEVQPMQAVDYLAPYRAVVLGSAIRDGKWLPEAMQFLQTHRVMLAQKPVATFLVCMTMAMKSVQAREMVPQWMEPVRMLVKPISEGYFAGALDISKVPSLRQRMLFRMSVWLGVWTEGDHRDWDAIRAWAQNLANILQPELAH